MFGPIFHGFEAGRDEHEERRRTRTKIGDTNSHPHTPVALVGPIHQLNRIHKKETQRVKFLGGEIVMQGIEIQEQKIAKG